MRFLRGLIVVLWSPALALTAGNSDSVMQAGTARCSFHHVHLNEPSPAFLMNFYERLFDPATIRRTEFGGVDALQSGSMLLVISRAPTVRQHATAVWHFGWGGVSLGETYLAHAQREVAWEPPLPADRLHVHLRSVAPPSAAAWYRDVLGARVESPTGAPRRRGDLPPPEHRQPEALVWIGGTGLLIYATDPPLISTRGQRVDHLALACSNLDDEVTAFQKRGVKVLALPMTAGGVRTAMIEGPDHLAMELVETR
jgi:catechol 2,3-dioxygenase-like lactoylglutathione lyase family enzyme